MKKYAWIFLLAFCWTALAFGQAQNANGNIHGQVTDPSGAVVVSATVTAKTADGQAHSGTTNRSGAYEIGDLPPGSYSVSAVAKGFAAFSQDGVQVAAGQAAQFNISLDIAVEQEKVNVEDNSTQVDVNPSSNASAIVLSGKDLEALPDDPDELQQDLQALAGPSAGPNGGQIYIDGFTAGQLPPKSSIREIRINQNPFSAEYDKLGYGRIEIFTKPGTDKFHGQVSVMGNSSAFNSKSPFLTEDPSYYTTIYQGNIGGPLGKKASVFFDFQRRNINEVAIVNGFVPDATNTTAVPFNESVPNPRTRTNLSPRFDYQISANNTLTARYQYFHDTQDNAGVGGFSLASTGYDATSSEHTFQISDTQVLNSKAINETRFQYIRENESQNPLNTGPTINVIGAFTGGGNGLGTLTDHVDRYELQNYTSLALGTHFVKFGGRLRIAHEASTSGQGYNGTFTFASIDDYMAELNNPSTAAGPVQFTVTASSAGGVPTVPATVTDAGLYVLDEWRVRPNITLSYGLRFETQNAIHDHGDWAPRVALAWGIGGDAKTAAKTVLRAGFGIFYDRFEEDLLLNTNRQNGVIQQQYIVSNPPTPIDFFPNVPPVSQLPPTTNPTIYQLGPDLRAPYTMQSAVSLERQVTKIANLTVSYLNSEGVHQFLSWNANAPLPGGPFSTGPRPDPNAGNIYQYASEGTFRQNQLITNFNIRAGTKLSLFGFYMLNYANSDSAGASSFPTNQYNIGVDYGRSTFDIRHRLFFGGTISLPYAFRLSPFMIVNSGSPYNVTAGQDLSNDSLFNDRPALAPNPAGVCVSPTEACHYVVPVGPYTPIPVNYLEGPAHFTLNFRLSKTFGFGPETGGKNAAAKGSPGGQGGIVVPRAGGPGGGGGGGGFGHGGGGGGMFGGGAASNRRYSLTLSVNARNVLNHPNFGAPIGNLTSPIFGESNSLAGGPFSSGPAVRKIELQAMFSF